MPKPILSYGVGDFLRKVMSLHPEDTMKYEVTGSSQARRLRMAAYYRGAEFRRGIRTFTYKNPRDGKYWLWVVRLY